MKTCIECHILKPFCSFTKAPANSDGYCNSCRECRKEYNKKHYEKNKINRQEIQRKYYHNNKEKEKERSLRKYSDPNQRINQIFSRCNRKAIAESREFNLTKEFLIVLMMLQSNKCALTGIEFDFSNPNNGNKRNPFGPSLDRIDSNKDYIVGNVQFVCWVVNAAKNEYIIDVFDKMCAARMRFLNGSEI